MDAGKLERLCEASLAKSFVPEKDVAWGVPFSPREGPALPESVISLVGSAEYAALSADQRSALARHELASMLSAFIRFESVINRYLGRVTQRMDAGDPVVAYSLHVIEEEARHSRMFARLISDLGTGTYSLSGAFGLVERLGGGALMSLRSLFFLGMLTVEEITDLYIARTLDARDLHPSVRDVGRIHRIEESRHMDFVRDYFAEHYQRAGRIERWVLRAAAPVLVVLVFELLVHPTVYQRAGIVHSRRATWQLRRSAYRSPQRRAFRRACAERIVRFLGDKGLIAGGGRRSWQAAGLLP